LNKTTANFLIILGIILIVLPMAIGAPTQTITSASFSDGFESGSTNNWTYTMGATVASSPVYAGSYSLKCVSGPTPSDVIYDTSGASAIELMLYLPNAPTGWVDTNFLYFLTSSGSENDGCQVQYTSDGAGNVGFEMYSNGAWSTFPYSIQSATWYKIALVANFAGNNYALWVNDQWIGGVSVNIAGLTSSRVFVGSVWGSPDTFYIDNVVIGTGFSIGYEPSPTPTPTLMPTPTPTATLPPENGGGDNPPQGDVQSVYIEVLGSNNQSIVTDVYITAYQGGTPSYTGTSPWTLPLYPGHYLATVNVNGVSYTSSFEVASSSVTVIIHVASDSPSPPRLNNSEWVMLQVAGAVIAVFGVVMRRKKR
jgi:hypothetical protein